MLCNHSACAHAYFVQQTFEHITSPSSVDHIVVGDLQPPQFGGNKTTKLFTLAYSEVISHELSLTGWARAVLHTASPEWKDIDLVAKISWPGSGRVPENKLVDKAIKQAKKTDRWAINHLPRVLFAQGVAFESDSTNEKIARLFYNAKFVNGEYKYERHTKALSLPTIALNGCKSTRCGRSCYAENTCIHCGSGLFSY